MVVRRQRPGRASRSRTGGCCCWPWTGRAGGEAWRRLRFVVDQARLFTDDVRRRPAPVPGLGRPAGAPRTPGSTEAVLPEPDLDAVRIMTVARRQGPGVPGRRRRRHRAARGPAVGAPGCCSVPAARSWRPAAALATAGYAALAAREGELDDDEQVRLLYVAATRARDHLVVSVHRAAGRRHRRPGRPVSPRYDPAVGAFDRPSRPGCAGRAPAHAGRRVAGAMATEERARRRGSSAPSRAAGHAAEDGLGHRRRRLGRRRASVDRSRRGPRHAATGRLASRPRPAPPSAGPSTPPSRSSTWPAGTDWTSWPARTASAEGVAGRADEVAQAGAGGARAADSVRAARGRRLLAGGLRREVRSRGRVLEGLVDLLVDGPDGLEVVDYKTDRVETEEEIDRAMGRHRLQGAAYAVAVAAATRPTGQPMQLPLLRRGRGVGPS